VSKPLAKNSTFLTIGSKGEAVKNVQNLLKEQKFYIGTVNGVFDQKTEQAVRKFQKSKGLKVDGIIGPKTLATLSK
jgi:peptidoglycan hydrolase-like protein with peptidoglycan-binding domain